MSFLFTLYTFLQFVNTRVARNTRVHVLIYEKDILGGVAILKSTIYYIILRFRHTIYYSILRFCHTCNFCCNWTIIQIIGILLQNKFHIKAANVSFKVA